MNKDVLNENSLLQFKKLVQSAESMNKDLDCYALLIKEMLIKSYCNN